MSLLILHPKFSGVRAFVTKPVATNLQYVGGAAAILGLVAMASDVEGLYAAVKALVCVVKSNPLASKEMERIKGYQVRHDSVEVALLFQSLMLINSIRSKYFPQSMLGNANDFELL